MGVMRGKTLLHCGRAQAQTIPLVQPTPPGLLLSVLLHQLPLAQRMLLSLLVFARIAGAERSLPRLTLPEMLLSYLLAQLTVPLVQLMAQLILQQLVRLQLRTLRGPQPACIPTWRQLKRKALPLIRMTNWQLLAWLMSSGLLLSVLLAQVPLA